MTEKMTKRNSLTISVILYVCIEMCLKNLNYKMVKFILYVQKVVYPGKWKGNNKDQQHA